jgi:hypothetical protein
VLASKDVSNNSSPSWQRAWLRVDRFGHHVERRSSSRSRRRPHRRGSQPHGVDYVVIGGIAAAAWAASVGVPVRPTLDVDLTPAADAANLDRLSAALKELGARVRTEHEPAGLSFAHDGKSLGQVLVWNLICPAGPFDLAFMPSGTGGYDDLARRARTVLADGLDTPIADLADIIRSKRAANRPKDLEALPDLEEALRRLDFSDSRAEPTP